MVRHGIGGPLREVRIVPLPVRDHSDVHTFHKTNLSGLNGGGTRAHDGCVLVLREEKKSEFDAESFSSRAYPLQATGELEQMWGGKQERTVQKNDAKRRADCHDH